MFEKEIEVYDFENYPLFLNELLNIRNIFRIKVWSKSGVILWSDKTEIIGEKFFDNVSFQKALSGDVGYTVEEPNNDENASEQEYNKILEIYTPIYKNNQVIGVLELYENYENLEKELYFVKRKISSIIIIAGSILYLLQFFIFYNEYKRLEKSNFRLEKTKEVTLFALATLAETRDRVTGEHIQRTSEYVKIIAEELMKTPEYSKYLTPKYIKDIVASSPLHDIGKVGIRDSILLKEGVLTPDEFEEMKKHCIIGTRTLELAESKVDFESFLSIAKLITHYHHEKWNGQGYPEGLSGNDIPISARIMALADVYDALRSKRPYKEEMTHEQAREIIVSERGKHFDPQLVDVFLIQETLFRNVSSTPYEVGKFFKDSIISGD